MWPVRGGGGSFAEMTRAHAGAPITAWSPIESSSAFAMPARPSSLTAIQVKVPHVVHEQTVCLPAEHVEAAAVHAHGVAVAALGARRRRHDARPFLGVCGGRYRNFASATPRPIPYGPTARHARMLNRYSASSCTSVALSLVSPPQMISTLRTSALACPTRGLGSSPTVCTWLVLKSETSSACRSLTVFSCSLGWAGGRGRTAGRARWAPGRRG